jgi:Cellulase (glycosyl hydrolase family 5)
LQLTRLALATAALLAVLAAVVTANVTPAHAAGCQHIAGPFHTSGAKVLNAAGQRYIPYGINVVGLAHPLTAMRNMAGTVSNDQAIIQAAATSWCSNTVRLQVGQDFLVAPGGKINRTFLAAVESEVDYARQLGLVVALNAQGQTGPNADQETMPTHRTIAFWQSLSYHYGKDPSVIFDLFNEPRKVRGWSFWRNGGWRHGTHFYGMQQVAKSIRQHGGRNLLWVEGPGSGATLGQAWAYRLRGVYPLMYAEHRPAGPHTAANWDRVFGHLAARNLAPVLNSEWTNYARGGGAWWACWRDARGAVPRWLAYFATRRMGMIVTRMTPGQLIQSASLDDPTHIRPNWSCTSGLNQGAGNQIRNWFTRQNT